MGQAAGLASLDGHVCSPLPTFTCAWRMASLTMCMHGCGVLERVKTIAD